MRLTYDASVDAAYIYVADRIDDGAVCKTLSCEPDSVSGSIHLDFDSSGHLLGIEVLGAKSVLPAETLRRAERPITHGAIKEDR
jgi:uncharacterized protein YuzE